MMLKSILYMLALCDLTTALTSSSSRRAFFSQTAAAVGGVVTAVASNAAPSLAAPQILTTSDGKIKYATLQPAKERPSSQSGDIVAIEYTGYLSNGQIFDGTHAEGKKNVLMFQLGGNGVIPGVSEMVGEMGVGQKVQAIIPPELAFGDKGLCLESGDCLIKPGATLVYDIFLKRAGIPPP
mmetsp:Transcript_10138/g.27950  ORF Transcript_10138/g.27950 Transcript_10138/m.27950 type:complete len:181 (+) Transcript_10138:82-624(+)